MDLEKLAQDVGEVMRQAAELVLSIPRPKVFTKEGHANFVTEADVASQKFLVEKLEALLPQAHFFAEEQDENVMAPGYNWVIDPIDGTTNFIRAYRPSAISVGLVEDGKGILGLVLDLSCGDLFSAVDGKGAFCNGEPIQASDTPVENALIAFGTSPYYRELMDPTFSVLKELFAQCGDLRRSGSAAVDLCNVAAGRCDGFFELQLSPGDDAAGSVILRESGAVIGTAPWMEFRYDRKQPIFAGTKALYPLLEQAVSAQEPALKQL